MKSKQKTAASNTPSEPYDAETSDGIMREALAEVGEAMRDYAAMARKTSHGEQFTDEQLEVIYAAGFARYTQGRFFDARQIFTFLTIYRPFHVRYLKALAAVHFTCGELTEAFHAYTTLKLLAPDDVLVQKRCAQCQERVEASLAVKDAMVFRSKDESVSRSGAIA